ncbi:hypothetical protein B0T14DRAFT_604375 [Immersiella caudata]|uniref:Uncharacterized protein n=1 Tax=Immersiella caudata TaxID=314043 RepID=A0AA39WSW3_9PEZI|nr:hypothetical protein B0T14DRAFT_604375 [Immersiella caudata]
MSSRAQESAMGDRFIASWHEASRVGRLVWGEASRVANTLNRIRIVATSPQAPIDDGWEVIEGKDVEGPEDSEPKRKSAKRTPNTQGTQLAGQSIVSTFQTNISDEEAVRNYRDVEKELKRAIVQGNTEAERRLRNELSKRRHDVWEKDKALWTTASTHGGRRASEGVDYFDAPDDVSPRMEETKAPLAQPMPLDASEKNAFKPLPMDSDGFAEVTEVSGRKKVPPSKKRKPEGLSSHPAPSNAPEKGAVKPQNTDSKITESSEQFLGQHSLISPGNIRLPEDETSEDEAPQYQGQNDNAEK